MNRVFRLPYNKIIRYKSTKNANKNMCRFNQENQIIPIITSVCDVCVTMALGATFMVAIVYIPIFIFTESYFYFHPYNNEEKS